MIILTRQQANNLSDNLVGIMTEIEDQLLRKIAEQLARDGNISDTSKWRIRQLARMGQLDREALRLIKSYSGVQSEVLYDTLMNAALTEIGYVDAGMREAAAKGLISGDMTIPADRTAVNALTAYQKQAQSDLNMVNTVMRYQATAAYTGAVNNIYYQVHNALDTGTATVVTGSESLQSAIRNTIKELSWKGIPAFVDKAGRHWSPEAYVRMDLRTTVGNTARAAQWSRCDNFGVSLIAVDSHPGARPKCAPYQGRIFSRDGSSGVSTDGSGRKITYSPLSSTSYGEPDGLFGINCGHSCYPFIPEVNFQRYFPYDPEENAARYKEFQTQRALEREIRASKRECMMLQAAGDKEGYEKAALRLRTQREKYRVYSNEHGLSLHNDRTQVYGFDRSQSMKAVWAERKAKKVKSAPSSGSSGGHAVTVDVPAPADNGGKGKLYRDVGLDKSGGSGIINTEMARIISHNRQIYRFISDKEFSDLTIEARKNGANILRGTDEIEKHLDEVGSSASTIGDTLLFRKKVTKSEVIEETHHFMQNISHMNDDKPEPLRTYLNEIEAKQFLLDNAQKYHIPRIEIEDTKNQLNSYRELLEHYIKENGDYE